MRAHTHKYTTLTLPHYCTCAPRDHNILAEIPDQNKVKIKYIEKISFLFYLFTYLCVSNE